MILKILIIVAVVATVYFLFFKTKPEVKPTKESQKLDADEMVECTECGVYAQVQESILSNGKYYCSRECLTKGK